MSFILIVIIIFILELINSFCADSRSIAVVQRKEWEADIFDAISSMCTWVIGFVIYVEYKELRFSIPSIIASVMGTHLATRRIYFQLKPPFLFIRKRKDRIKRPKTPATTA